MRARSIVAAPALIAATALVAFAGPATTTAPGASQTVEQDAFRPLTLDLATDSAATELPLLPDSRSAGALRDTSILLEPIGLVEPRRPPVPQPAVSAHVVDKSAWRRAEYSWYGPGFYGSGTACGQRYSKTILGVAHRTLPCGTRVTLRNPRNGRTITVPVIDRGPYVAGRMWDLSRGTCTYLRDCYTATIEWRLP